MSPPPSGRRLVWVVDDSPLDAERARRCLSSDFEVEVFPDGALALERLAAGPHPDVCVVDWMMPGVSGIELCRFVRSPTQQLSHIQLLLLTAQQETAQIVEGLVAGANDFLSKPYADAELRARVQALVRSAALMRRAEDAEGTVRQLLATSPDALLAVDAAGVVTFANPEAERAFARPLREIAGRQVSELLPMVELGQLRGAGETHLSLPDMALGENIYAPVVRVRPPGGGTYTVIALRDVTKRRRQEARRLDFYSILAHDLRSPLSAILLRGDMLMRRRGDTLPADVLSHLHKTQANVASLMAMINEFLDLARFEGMGFVLEREELDLVDLVRTTAEDLRPLAEARQVQLQVAVSGPVGVFGDRGRLGQVVANLIGNAIKFTPAKGTIVAQVAVNGHCVETSVVDDGPGIPADALPTIFERYTRAVGASVPGSGLGLMIVREIVDAHGGSVGVTSTPGHGSRFWFRLPRTEADSRSRPRELRVVNQ